MKTRIIVRKLRIEMVYRVLLRFRDAVVSALNVAHVDTLPSLLRDVKG